MALRLTGTTQVSERKTSPQELAAQAASLLAGGDHARYAELFGRVATLEDPFDRIHARLLLVERALGAASTASTAQAVQIYFAAAAPLVDVLAEDPRDPQLLNYAGIIFYELWSLDAARALFKAAQRLDPEMPNPRRNLAEVERRKRSGRGPQAQLRPVHTKLPALARRAKQIAAAARPAQDLTLSLCMIVRDEEEMLPRCLAAVAPAVDEIVIVDTGSTDRTVEIARSFGARVIEHEWTGSFAEARNVSLDAATGDWIIYLDADEVLVSDDVQRLRALTGQVWREAIYLLETSYTGEEGDGTSMVHPALRVLRNRPNYRFEGRLHEQFASRLPAHVPGRVGSSSVRITHYGYLGSVRNAKEKSRRNIELLQAQLEEGQSGPYVHFNLGTEYAAIGHAPAALRELTKAWDLVKRQGEHSRDYVPTLVVRLVSAQCSCGQIGDALTLIDEALGLFPGFTDLVFSKAQALSALGRDEEAAEAWARCLAMGDAPARYGANVGAGSFLALLALANLHRRHGRFDPALELLRRCLDEHPDFAGAAGPFAATLVASGVEAAEAIAEVERSLPAVTPTVRYVLATALHGQGALAEAETQYRAVLARRPGNAQVRVTLGEMLVGQAKYAPAAEIVEPIEGDDPFAAMAARIDLWCAIAGGELARVPAARERAAAAGVSQAELEVFDGWRSIAAGEGAPSGLGVAGTPLLGVILDTLLAAHDFTAFEALLPLLSDSGLPGREQHELLAGMYLRHGFLQSAAAEWMAVCEREPDARAFAGLAQVARAHGLAEDAVTFAQQALLLDSSNLAARSVVAALEREPALAA